MVSIAAVGDVHFGLDSAGTLRPQLEDIADCASLLLIAGDLTRHGDPAEASVLGRELAGLDVPVVVTLGNHDHHQEREDELADALREHGVLVLEGQAAHFEFNGVTVGVVGEKGFGGGFAGRCGTEFGEIAMKQFIRCTRDSAARLDLALTEVADADVRVVLLHYSPVPDTLVGEPPEIFPFLGSYLLAEVIDEHHPDIVFHGHAHHGTHRGCTVGGVPVRNVAQPLIQAAYGRFDLAGRKAAKPQGERATAAS